MKLYEQADKTGSNVIYSWILIAPYKMRKELETEGWKWLKGGRSCRGCYVTRNCLTAFFTSRQFKLGKPESNGTHKVHNVDMAAVPNEVL